MGAIESRVDKTVSRSEEELEEWGARLDSLLAKAEATSQEARSETREHLDELKSNILWK